jgi:hypothetical protein
MAGERGEAGAVGWRSGGRTNEFLSLELDCIFYSYICFVKRLHSFLWNRRFHSLVRYSFLCFIPLDTEEESGDMVGKAEERMEIEDVTTN